MIVEYLTASGEWVRDGDGADGLEGSGRCVCDASAGIFNHPRSGVCEGAGLEDLAASAAPESEGRNE